uniref:Uncharacterized protein n=1 Tax=Cuerna arida TaxID=1464854 RepID=A0A1B6FLK6_9HEMI
MASNDCNRSEAEKLLFDISRSSEKYNENLDFIECKMVPQFKCKLCNIIVGYNENKDKMLSSFAAHLKVPGHQNRLKKCLQTVSIIKKFKALSIYEECCHNLSLVDDKVVCSECNISVNINWDKNMSIQTVKEEPKPDLLVVNDFKSLIDSLGKPFEDIDYIVEGGRGQVRCLICNCVLPATAYSLKYHLVGINHKKNRDKKRHNNPSQEPRSGLCFDEIYKRLVETDPVIAANKKVFVKRCEHFYICMWCSALIEGCNKINVFRNNFHQHIESIQHEEKLQRWIEWSNMPFVPDSNAKLTRLFGKLSSNLQHNIEYIRGPSIHGKVFCYICCISIGVSNISSLEGHLRGAFHASSKKRFQLLLEHDCPVNAEE